MRKILHTLLLAAVTIAAASCVTDEVGKSDPRTETQTDVLLRLKTSGSFASSGTRALTLVDENELTDVYVLVFDKDDMMVDIQKGEDVTSSVNDDQTDIYSGGGEFSITLPTSTGVGAKSSSKLVVLANAENILDAIGMIDKDDLTQPSPSVGEDYETTVGRVYAEITEAMFTSGESIPMWGETGQIEITPSVNPEIELMRAVARIDVGLGDAAIPAGDGTYTWDGNDAADEKIPFRMTSVNVVKANVDYRIVPDAMYLTTEGSKPSVSLPTNVSMTKFEATQEDADKFEYTATGGLYSTQSIYVPEANILMGGTESGDGNHKSRMAVVVGGYYSPDPLTPNTTTLSYYRLDFAHGKTLMNVLRNHLYQFNIQSVSDEGYPSVIEAYEANETKMTAEIVVWDNGGAGDHDFNGQYYLRVSQSDFVFPAEGGEQVLEITTDFPGVSGMGYQYPDAGWIGAYLLLGGPIGTPQWFHLFHEDGTPNGTTTTQPRGGVGTTKLIIRMDEANNTGKNHVGGFGVAAGNLRKHITVTQKALPQPGILAAPGTIGYIKGTNTLTINGSKEFAGTPVMGFNGDTNLALATGHALENATVYAAYFKFGSLIATRSEYVTSTFTPDDIVAAPKDYAGAGGSAATALAMIQKAAGGAAGTNTGTAAWSTIPYYTAQAPGNAPDLDLSVADPAAGFGDPCAYYFGDGWKLPTGGPWYKEGGYPFGVPTRTSWPGSVGFGPGAGWITQGTSNLPVAGAVGGKSAMAGDHDWSMFLTPAEGRNFDTGARMGGQGVDGYYWSSTSAGAAGGNYLYVNDGKVQPSGSVRRDAGFAARCVKPASKYVDVLNGMLEYDRYGDALSGIYTIEIDTNVTDPNDLIITPPAGFGGSYWADLTSSPATIYYRPEALTSIYEPCRYGELKIEVVGGGDPELVTVKQFTDFSNDYIPVTTPDVTIDSSGNILGGYFIQTSRVLAPEEWIVTVEAGGEWLHIIPYNWGYYPDDVNIISAYCEPNYGTTDRTTTVTLTQRDVNWTMINEVTFTVTQQAP